MALDETDPEIIAMRLKLDEYNAREATTRAKMRIHERQHKQIQEQLYRENNELQQIIGGKIALEETLGYLKGDNV